MTDRKRNEISSTPAKSTATKRYRPDLNADIVAAQGMDLLKDNPTSLEDIVKETITKILPDAFGKPNVNTNVVNDTGRGKKGATKNVDCADIVSNVLKQLVPVIVAAVCAAVKDSVVAAITELKIAEKDSNAKIQQLALLAKYDHDKLEQYSRRETLRISGIDEKAGEREEDLVKEVVGIAKSIGVEIKDEDISVTHRADRPAQNGTSPRPVLCKFISRRVKDKLVKNRAKLKDIPEAKGKIYINEDLTTLRAKLLSYAKSLDNVKRVSSSNGRIHCNTVDDKHIVLDSPDDLFKLGVDSPNLDRLGLARYIITA